MIFNMGIPTRDLIGPHRLKRVAEKVCTRHYLADVPLATDSFTAILLPPFPQSDFMRPAGCVPLVHSSMFPHSD